MIHFEPFSLQGVISEGSKETGSALLLAEAEMVVGILSQLHVLQQCKDVHSTVGCGVQAFAADLERLYTGFSSLDAEVVMSASRSGEAMAASLNLDDAQINRLLLQVGDVPFGC